MLMEGSRAFWRKCHINLRFLLFNLCVHEISGWYGISNTEHCKVKAKLTQSLLFCNTWWHSLGRGDDAITMKLSPRRLDGPKEFICAIYVIVKKRSSYFHSNNDNSCFHWGTFILVQIACKLNNADIGWIQAVFQDICKFNIYHCCTHYFSPWLIHRNTILTIWQVQE